MSATTLQIDPYLAAQTMPWNDLVVDPQWKNMRLTTPVGRFPYIHVDRPFAIPNRDPGKPAKPMYSATLMMAPGTEQHPIVADLYRAMCMVADAAWPAVQRPDPNNPSSIVTVPGSALFGVDAKLGGIHCPLRLGDDNYMKEPQKFASWRGLYFINCGMNPTTKNGVEQRPICLDERGMACDPKLFYPGCYGRMQVTVAAFDNSGNRGVTFYLNAVQFARHGEKMASFDGMSAAQAAFTKAGALPGDIGTPPAGMQTGFGPNTASPATVSPGTPFGFAAPPTSHGAPAGGFAAPPVQQAPAGGARPPGV